jgi:tetratricopeptide (TPR) repeat protein
MLRRGCACLFVLLSLAAANAKDGASQKNTTLPITTSSVLARKYFDRAMRRFEDYRLTEALPDFREATHADPRFAQAYIMIAKISKDPAEQASARAHAKKLASGVSAGEQLLIRWLAGAQEDDYLPAIAAMNDLLAQYPDDCHLAFLAGDWLTLQARYEQAAVILQHALTLRPDYPAALNDIGYTYAYSGDFEKAFAAMERYAALEPDEPNPRDSYGELLRMDGKFDAALDQYRMSVRIDPNFGSEVGIADTYALMGRKEDAREEYARAIVFAGSQSDKIDYELQSAITWIRESNRKQAGKSLDQAARHAHLAGLGRLEAEAHLVAAMDEPDSAVALKHLETAERALAEHEISASDRTEEHARIVRVQASRLAEAGDAASAAKAVDELAAMAAKSRSRTVQLCYHGAAGELLVTQGKFADAIPHLEEGNDDPLAMRLLWRAYSSTGASQQAQELATKLARYNVPTVEQALVVPQFRASLVSQAGQP